MMCMISCWLVWLWLNWGVGFVVWLYVLRVLVIFNVCDMCVWWCFCWWCWIVVDGGFECEWCNWFLMGWVFGCGFSVVMWLLWWWFCWGWFVWFVLVSWCGFVVIGWYVRVLVSLGWVVYWLCWWIVVGLVLFVLFGLFVVLEVDVLWFVWV